MKTEFPIRNTAIRRISTGAPKKDGAKVRGTISSPSSSPLVPGFFLRATSLLNGERRAPSPVRRAEREIDLASSDRSLVIQDIGLALVVGIQPERYEISVNLPIVDFDRSRSHAFRIARDSGASALQIEH